MVYLKKLGCVPRPHPGIPGTASEYLANSSNLCAENRNPKSVACSECVAAHRRFTKDNSGGCVPCTEQQDSVGSLSKTLFFWCMLICVCLQFYGIHKASQAGDQHRRSEIGAPAEDITAAHEMSGGEQSGGAGLPSPPGGLEKTLASEETAVPPSATASPAERRERLPATAASSFSKRASRASVVVRGGMRELVGEASSARSDVQLDDIRTILTALKQVIKYSQGVFLIGRYDLHLPDLNLWFFKVPEWAFEFTFEFYALECIFAENRFLGYVLGKWFSIIMLLLGIGVGVLLSNFFVLFFLRCLWKKGPTENAAAIARKEEKQSNSSSVFGSFRVAAYVASAYVPLERYLKGCVVFLILSFAIFSLFMLDYFDCVSHPSTNNVENEVYTHRVFRSVHCWEGFHQKLMPGACLGLLLLMALPGFVVCVWQSHALWVARQERKHDLAVPRVLGRSNKLKQIRHDWNFLWIGFRERCAYWNAVIMTKDLLFAGCGIYFSGALAQGSSSALVLALYLVLVFK